MKHRNIALFVTDAGCPHRCSFCNQAEITGNPQSARPEDVAPAVETALRAGTHGAQLAFFGGSFTCIPRGEMTAFLEAAQPYIADGSISGIRVSTRPDGISPEILDILERYHVEAVELGAQSMDDEVLLLNRRGHTAEDVVKASALIAERDIELGLQQMTGLYGSSPQKDLDTAEKLISLHPATIRIYPTLVMEHTENAARYYRGDYIPETVDEAVQTCTPILQSYLDAGIRVIRLGLHAGGNVEEGYLAGPWHPAFRELVEGSLYLQKAEALLRGRKPGRYRLLVRPSEISKMTGQKRKNIIELEKYGFLCRVRGKADLSPFEIRIEEE